MHDNVPDIGEIVKTVQSLRYCSLCKLTDWPAPCQQCRQKLWDPRVRGKDLSICFAKGTLSISQCLFHVPFLQSCMQVTLGRTDRGSVNSELVMGEELRKSHLFKGLLESPLNLCSKYSFFCSGKSALCLTAKCYIFQGYLQGKDVFLKDNPYDDMISAFHHSKEGNQITL